MPKETQLNHVKPIAYLGVGPSELRKYCEADTNSIIESGMWRGRSAISGGVHLEGNILELASSHNSVVIDISALLHMIAEHDQELLIEVLQIK